MTLPERTLGESNDAAARSCAPWALFETFGPTPDRLSTLTEAATMDDAPPQDPPRDETPMQKALRLKRAAQGARGGPPGAGRLRDERAAAAASSSKSKPWMKK